MKIKDYLKGKMNRPEDFKTIDLLMSKKDYKEECERLASILEQVTHEKDEVESQLQFAQNIAGKQRYLIKSIRALLDIKDL